VDRIGHLFLIIPWSFILVSFQKELTMFTYFKSACRWFRWLRKRSYDDLLLSIFFNAAIIFENEVEFTFIFDRHCSITSVFIVRWNDTVIRIIIEWSWIFEERVVQKLLGWWPFFEINTETQFQHLIKLIMNLNHWAYCVMISQIIIKWTLFLINLHPTCLVF